MVNGTLIKQVETVVKKLESFGLHVMAETVRELIEATRHTDTVDSVTDIAEEVREYLWSKVEKHSALRKKSRQDFGPDRSRFHEGCMQMAEQLSCDIPRMILEAKPDTCDSNTVAVDEWLIQRRRAGVRPEHRGYTNDINEAGRYSEAEAKKAERMKPHKCKAVRLPSRAPLDNDVVEFMRDAIEPILDACGNSYSNAWCERLLTIAKKHGAYSGPVTGRIGDLRTLLDQDEGLADDETP